MATKGWRFASLAAVVILVGCGKVDRQMAISSHPAGALVYLNGQEVGRTPCTVDFTWYGKYDVTVRKDGYESLRTTQAVMPPWWQWIPLDLMADLTPGLKIDRHEYAYELKPITGAGVDASVLIDRAQSMRPSLESGEFTHKPATRPAARPATVPTTMPSR